MARHKVEICGVNTANIQVLSQEEMEDLFKKMQKGDKSARERLVNGNLKLVLSILKKFNNHVDNLDDLFQIGCIGLLKAIDNFDLSFGVKFSTYCVPMIQGEVKRFLRDNNSIRVSRSVKDLSYKILKLKEEYIMKNQKEPSINEMAKALDVTPYEVINALESMRDPISIFEPIYNDGGDTIYLYDQIEDKKGNGKELDSNLAINDAIDRLNDRERFVLDQRFVIGKTQMEVSKELGISQAQVKKKKKSVVESLRDKLN